MEKNCDKDLQFKTKELSKDPHITLIEINKKTDSDVEKNKIFIEFGQHAREMISTEVGLFFVE